MRSDMVHYAAGILPITRGRDGTPLFLIGKDIRDQSWSDFGGKCERVDKGEPLVTAIREFFEETYGCLVDARTLRQRLHPGNCLCLKSRTQNNHEYFMYVVEMPYLPHLRNAFLKTLNFLRSKQIHRMYVEKTDVQYVTWDAMIAPSLLKRGVFKNTIDQHAATLEKLANGVDLAALCA